MSIASKAQALQLDVDNALASMEEVYGFLQREWNAQELDSVKELYIHGMWVELHRAMGRLRKHATGTE